MISASGLMRMTGNNPALAEWVSWRKDDERTFRWLKLQVLTLFMNSI